MGLRYIGSKARVADGIGDHLGAPRPDRGVFLDAFCGTGSVAVAAADRGWAVGINDSLQAAVTLTTARLLTGEQVPFAALGGYQRALRLLNELPRRPGFCTREYSPHDAHGPGRCYFTPSNAQAIDTMRAQLRTWRLGGELTDGEHTLLLADLLTATSAVANTAGTYGAFHREFSRGAQRELRVLPRTLRTTPVSVIATVGDVTAVVATAADTVYYDPPYTKRQYAAYYHVLETITVGDEPDVGGVTGLRPWRHLASDFSYRSKALGALIALVQGCGAGRVLLSYSDQGHVGRGELTEALTDVGDLVVHPLAEIARYRPNRAAAAHSSAVQEYLFDLRPYAAQREVAA